jgi:hypothetical protein
MADIKSESVADFTSEAVAGLLWNQQASTVESIVSPSSRRRGMCL